VLHSITAGAAETPGGLEDDELIARLLRQASDEFRATHRSGAERPAAVRSEREVQALARALEGLVKVLSGQASRRFRIASTSHRGLEYEIVAIDADVTCTCPGFEYRGQCRHARDVKAALAAGRQVPAAYAEVGSTS
jgi:hypothetical protein